MSHKLEISNSDDEFQDALSESPKMDNINEFVEKSRKLKQDNSDEVQGDNTKTTVDNKNKEPDDGEAGAIEINKEMTTKLKRELDAELREEPDGASGSTDSSTTADVKKEPDCELSVEEMQEKEKNCSAEELEQNKEKAAELKLIANDHFKNDEAQLAVKIYTEALNVCPLANAKERSVLYGNRAAAKMKLGATKAAIDDCSKAIELWPEYVRALLRRAKLYELDDRLDEALTDYKRVYEIDPGQKDAREGQIRLPPLINQRNEKLKAEMMSNLKDLGNMILKPFGLSTSNFQMQQDPNSGGYSINFNQNNR